MPGLQEGSGDSEDNNNPTEDPVLVEHNDEDSVQAMNAQPVEADAGSPLAVNLKRKRVFAYSPGRRQRELM